MVKSGRLLHFLPSLYLNLHLFGFKWLLDPHSRLVRPVGNRFVQCTTTIFSNSLTKSSNPDDDERRGSWSGETSTCRRATCNRRCAPVTNSQSYEVFPELGRRPDRHRIRLLFPSCKIFAQIHSSSLSGLPAICNFPLAYTR